MGQEILGLTYGSEIDHLFGKKILFIYLFIHKYTGFIRPPFPEFTGLRTANKKKIQPKAKIIHY